MKKLVSLKPEVIAGSFSMDVPVSFNNYLRFTDGIFTRAENQWQAICSANTDARVLVPNW